MEEKKKNKTAGATGLKERGKVVWGHKGQGHLRQILSKSTHSLGLMLPSQKQPQSRETLFRRPTITSAAAGLAGAGGLHTELSPGRPRVGRDEPSSVYFPVSLYRRLLMEAHFLLEAEEEFLQGLAAF